MTPRRRDDPDAQLDALQAEVAELNQRLSACHSEVSAARRELQGLPTRLVAARAAAERGRDPDNPGVLAAREQELQRSLADRTEQAAALEAAIREVGRDIREHQVRHAEHYAGLAHQASEAAVVALGELRAAVDRLEAARRVAEVAWSVVPETGAWPHAGDLAAVRFHIERAADVEPWPRGVDPRPVHEDEPAAA